MLPIRFFEFITFSINKQQRTIEISTINKQQLKINKNVHWLLILNCRPSRTFLHWLLTSAFWLPIPSSPGRVLECRHVLAAWLLAWRLLWAIPKCCHQRIGSTRRDCQYAIDCIDRQILDRSCWNVCAESKGSEGRRCGLKFGQDYQKITLYQNLTFQNLSRNHN